MKTDINLWLYLAQHLVDGKMFQTKIVEKIKTNISCSMTFFPENGAIYEIIWKNIVEPDRP